MRKREKGLFSFLFFIFFYLNFHFHFSTVECRHDFYESNLNVNMTIYAKKVVKDESSITFHTKEIDVVLAFPGENQEKGEGEGRGGRGRKGRGEFFGLSSV